MDIHESEQWYPWARDDRAARYEAAIAIFGQWTRVEPGFRQKTREEFEAEHEQWRVGLDASIKAETARREQEHSPGPASPPPKPEPLAVIASGMPIGEVISQMTARRRPTPAPKSAAATATAGKSGPHDQSQPSARARAGRQPEGGG